MIKWSSAKKKKIWGRTSLGSSQAKSPDWPKNQYLSPKKFSTVMLHRGVHVLNVFELSLCQVFDCSGVYASAQPCQSKHTIFLTIAPPPPPPQTNTLIITTDSALTLSQFAHSSLSRCAWSDLRAEHKQPGHTTLLCLAIDSLQAFHTWAWDWSVSLRGRKINGLMGKWLWLPTLYPPITLSICPRDTLLLTTSLCLN